ncbi:hypothetical protein [Mycolicibacterium peregrinum]|uniref:hypothetical protein n=1 Tax=Mycolicibacterium peregrinum TaxID=43304 RepID=UPI00095A6A15|nr:hypothetical protein [Mycolicibacterium peregrinum]OLP03322.1 hypothetical protein BVU76_06320 [Mycolicibacterium porcinum]
MLTIRKLMGSVFVAGAAVAIAAGPTAALMTDAPATTISAQPSGGGDAGGGGGCDSGPGWNGCGGWNPVQGGWGHGCLNGICGGWDGQRGWGN